MRTRTRTHTIARRFAFGVALIALTGSPALGLSTGTIEGTLDGLGKGPVLVYVEKIPGATYAPANPPPVMNQKRNTYLPHILPVVAGSKVEFHSGDPELHNVYALALAAKSVLFNLSIVPGVPGHFYNQVFTKEGVVRLTCNIHKEMLAFIVVLQNPHYVVVEKATNQFRLAGVPPGKHALRIWGEKLDEAALARRFPIEVTAGGTARISIAQGGQKP